MSLARPAEKADRFQSILLVAAFVVTLLWGAAYIGQNRSGIMDEGGQADVIKHFVERRPGAPDALPNLPGYHFLVIWLTPGEPTLRSARLVTLGFALAGLAIFAAAWRQIHGKPPGGATFLFATLPILQPFTAMVYTDVPAITLLVAAVWAHHGRRPALAAGLLTLACLIRQTCLIWAIYLLVLDALNKFRPRNGPPPPTRAALGAWVEDGRWLLLLLAVAVGVVLHAGRLTVGLAHGNRPEPNLATLHFAGAALLVFGLPYWVTNGAAMARTWCEARQSRPGLTWGLTLLALACAGILALTYTNPHVWNRAIFWNPPAVPVMLRNVPLVWMDQFPILRVLSGLTIVTLLAGLAYLFHRQVWRRELWLILPFGTMLLLTNGLVEPRYLIPPCVLGLLWLNPGADLERQAVWFAILCLLQSPFALAGLALW